MLSKNGGGGAYLAYQMITGEKGKTLELKAKEGWENIEKNIEKIKKALRDGRIVVTGELFSGHWCMLDKVGETNKDFRGRLVSLEVSDVQAGAPEKVTLVVPENKNEPMKVRGAGDQYAEQKYNISVLISKKF